MGESYRKVILSLKMKMTLYDVEPIEQVDEELPLPPYEPPLRRSTRERQPSTRYPPNEYVMRTD